MTDEELELTCFSLITSAGAAKSCYVQAVESARSGDLEAAEAQIAEGDKVLVEGHGPHTTMIQHEAAGDKTQVSLLLVHAEDQMATAESFKELAVEMIEVYRQLGELRELVGAAVPQAQEG